MQRRGVADGRDPEEANLALLAQAFERRHHVAENLPDAQRRSVLFLGNRIVQMKDVDPVEMQPGKTAFQRCRDSLANAAELARRHANLGADDCVRRFQLLQNTAKILFRYAIAVLHRGVEIIHAGVERPRDGALLVGTIAAHHQPADGAAAEAQHRELHSRPPEHTQLHRLASYFLRMIFSENRYTLFRIMR